MQDRTELRCIGKNHYGLPCGKRLGMSLNPVGDIYIPIHESVPNPDTKYRVQIMCPRCKTINRFALTVAPKFDILIPS